MFARRCRLLRVCALLTTVAGAAAAVGYFVIWDRICNPEVVYEDSAPVRDKPFRKKVGIHVQVADAQEGEPVREATIELWRGIPDRRPPGHDDLTGGLLASGRTGPGGAVTLSTEFSGVTKGDRYGEWNWVDFEHHTIVVQAEGYATVETPLAARTGKRRLDRASDMITLQFNLDRLARASAKPVPEGNRPQPAISSSMALP